VCAVSHYLEAEGIMTTGISLVRENAESLRPPRTLWVSFPLGRPLGKPGDPEFQHKVIQHALDLLERKEGPVLEDFPQDAPAVSLDQAPACPISFARPTLDDDSWQGRLKNELLEMKPWYDLSRRRRGRTTVGICDSNIDEILEGLATWLDDPQQPFPDLKWFKYAIEDAKAYYSEALTAQPGDYPPQMVSQLLWQETVLGAGMKVFYEQFVNHEQLNGFARVVAPREAIKDNEGDWK
jgi:D-proline reductase (dithiol) PrdB